MKKGIPLFGAGGGEGVLDGFAENGHREGFLQQRPDAELAHALFGNDVPVAGRHHDREVGADLEDPFGEIGAAHPGHGEVGEEDVEIEGVRQEVGERFERGDVGRDPIAQRLELVA